MLQNFRSASHTVTGVFCLSLSCLLVISLCTPFIVRRAEAAAGGKLSAPPPASAEVTPKGGRREGELLIRFRDGVSEQDKSRVVEAKGAGRGKRLRGGSRVEKLEARHGQDVDALLAELRQNSLVEFVEPNYLINRDEVVPDDPRFPEQWALKNNGATGGLTGADVQTVPAWQLTKGARKTVIAVVDSGIDFSHPDLQNNQWTNDAERNNGKDDDGNGLTDDLHGWDWVTNSGAVIDGQGHGTLVAGIIAAEGNNGVGTTGVMWRAGLMSLRVLDNAGAGDVADAVEAIDYAVEHGARVINCSWGTDQESAALKEAIQRAGAGGAVVVSSAGNDGRDVESAPHYPASFGLSNVISVAATDSFDQLAPWSNYGQTRVTVAAPGTDILTTKVGGGYTNASGTSASTPLVAGVAGLVRTRHHGLSADATRAAIVEGARRVEGLTGKVSSGGVVSAWGALAASQESRREPPRPQPQPPGDGGGGPPSGETNPGAPGPNLPDLNDARSAEPSDPVAPSPIRADAACLDCDPGGGEPPPASGSDPYFSTARTRPQNETGEQGVDLGSRNFNWSLPLVHLSGRSGMDLDIGITYNSLVWTRQGNSIMFNADRGTPTPGFRLGLPTLEGHGYTDEDELASSILIVMPSGRRVQLMRVGTTFTYEAHDSSYMHAVDTSQFGADFTVRTSEGTQYRFNFAPGAPGISCSQIKDRNGNYITINYANGRVSSMIDTLARTVNFNYNADNLIGSITQSWNGQTHTWATFGYGNLAMNAGFSGLSYFGPTGSIPVLTQIGLDDGTRYNFDYTPWGQVWKIRHHAQDGHLLSYIGYNLPGSQWEPYALQTDCPRFTEQHDWAEYWNNDAEAVTLYSVDPNSAGGEQPAWSQVTTPDGTTHKETFATTGWQKGLTTGTEVKVGSTVLKSTAIAWTQDDTTLTYAKNPRPSEMTVEDDANNLRRMTYTYLAPTSFSLPTDVYEYAADGTTLLRRTHTNYNLAAVYKTNRIIGLPSSQIVYDGAGVIVSKVEYQYDEGGAWFADKGAIANHDPAYDGATSYGGRGNLTSIRRWNAEFPTDATKLVESNIGYNNAGSVVLERDPLSHQSAIDYTDKFSTAVGVTTLAYPTRVTPPLSVAEQATADDFASTSEYHYYTGAVSKRTRPSGVAANDEEMTFLYDTAGRLTRVTNLENGAYTRWVYATSNTLIQRYQTVSGTAEAYASLILDGAGRVRATSLEHTFTSTGTTNTYSGQMFIYDVMGRLWKRSNPTEMTGGGWTATGDDAATGWKYTTQTYDWNNRPLVTTNTDNTTRTVSYNGCGCAGGESVTTTDERGRRKRLSRDVLGRHVKTEEFNFDGTVYATTSYAYDALDQLTQINQAGQVRTFDYDGHGRLVSQTTPEQGTTTYAYNKDDTVQKLTDARGASATVVYNYRHQPTTVTYGVPAGVAATPNVTYVYDAAGNRTSMTEKNSAGTVVGGSTYHYDSLSRMDWEERNFPGVGTYRLAYEYNRAGGLTKLTGPSQFGGVEVGYSYDQLGRTTGVTGANYAGVASYVSNVSYRAFGAPKQFTYGNARALSLSYDTRLRLTQWNVAGVMGWSYAYSTPLNPEKTGRVAFANSLNDGTLDRSYEYDHLGRLGQAQTGNYANGHAGYTSMPTGTPNGPYAESYGYDRWGNTTARNGWGASGAQYNYNPQFVNNRMTINPLTGAAMGYDASGNLLNDGQQSFTYDATGQQATASGTGLTQVYDGDALRVKKTENAVTTLYLRSSVLGGQVVLEIGGSAPNSGQMMRGYVRLGRQMLAVQQGGEVAWVHQDPVTKSQRLTDAGGIVVSTVDLDPWGAETARSNNSQLQPYRFNTYERDANGGDEAMLRRYESGWARFSQPDPHNGSYNLSDPQSLNRYSYTNDDPVNFTDPTGLLPCVAGNYSAECGMSGFGGWGGGYMGGNGWGSDPRPGRRTIIEAEYDHDYRFYPEGHGPFRFNSAFNFGSEFGGYVPQETPQQKAARERAAAKSFIDCVKSANWSRIGGQFKAGGKTLLGGAIGLGGLLTGAKASNDLRFDGMSPANAAKAVVGAFVGGLIVADYGKDMMFEGVADGNRVEAEFWKNVAQCEQQHPGVDPGRALMAWFFGHL
ncbi:MAG TPA: S8 family serine peptidase [Pyrinomonadaceae bacterium]